MIPCPLKKFVYFFCEFDVLVVLCPCPPKDEGFGFKKVLLLLLLEKRFVVVGWLVVSLIKYNGLPSYIITVFGAIGTLSITLNVSVLGISVSVLGISVSVLGISVSVFEYNCSWIFCEFVDCISLLFGCVVLLFETAGNCGVKGAFFGNW